MATFHTQSTKGRAIRVVYPAEKRPGVGSVLLFRIGKQTVKPAFNDANLQHLDQFDIGQRTVMLKLSDILHQSYWQRFKAAYSLFGQLEVANDVKIGVKATAQLTQWLRMQSSRWRVYQEATA